MIKNKLNIISMRNHFESSLLICSFVVGIDLLWCIKDIVHNGMDAGYLFILSGLIAGFVLLSIVAFNFHIENVRHEAELLSESKKQRAKARKKSIARHDKKESKHAKQDRNCSGSCGNKSD